MTIFGKVLHSFLFFKTKLFMCLSGCSGSKVACGTLSFGMWDLSLDQGLNLGSLLWEHQLLATGPPGKSSAFILDKIVQQPATEETSLH